MRHPLHSICPYFAMFPEAFVAEQVLAFTRPGDLVFDPFCGRGTTILESLLNGRSAIGVDINPVAACIAGAKADVPTLDNVLERLDYLEGSIEEPAELQDLQNDFFSACFHEKTFSQIVYLRKSLQWRVEQVDRFIAALTLGVLHGESHRSEMCLSNRMPRTISTKPEYSVRWWRARGLEAPLRDVFSVLRKAARLRFLISPPKVTGKVKLGDARHSADYFLDQHYKVALLVTSPPYFDTTDYSEDQWLRLWFLGGNERPIHRLNRDDRHTILNEYWIFLEEVWTGIHLLLREDANIIIRIGGTRMKKDILLDGLTNGLMRAMPTRNIRVRHSGRSSEILNRQTDAFRPGTTADREEHDFAFSLSVS